MARIEESVRIKRPVNEVFAYTTDAKNWPKWQTFIPEAEQTSQGPMNVGTTFRGVSRMMGRSMEWTAITTEFEPNRKWGKNITSGGITIEEHVTYGSAEGVTTFTILYEMKGGGFVSPLLPIMAASMRKETKKSLGKLRDALETQSQ